MTQNPNDDMELEMMEAFTSEKSDKEISMPDIEQELARVKEGHRHAASPMRKLVAMIVAAFVISGIAVAAIINHEAISHFFSGETTTAVVERKMVKQTKINPLMILPSDTAKIEQGQVMFENAELVNIMTSICNTYKKDVVFRNEKLKHVRLHFQYNTEDRLEDVMQSLNMFEKIHVRLKNDKLEVE